MGVEVSSLGTVGLLDRFSSFSGVTSLASNFRLAGSGGGGGGGAGTLVWRVADVKTMSCGGGHGICFGAGGGVGGGTLCARGGVGGTDCGGVGGTCCGGGVCDD